MNKFNPLVDTINESKISTFAWAPFKNSDKMEHFGNLVLKSDEVTEMKMAFTNYQYGANFAVVLSPNQVAYSFGLNSKGQCGRGENEAPSNLNMSLKKDYRDLGPIDGPLKYVKIRDIACGSSHAMATTMSGLLYS